MQSSVIATYVNSEKVCIFCNVIVNHSDVETSSIILSLTTCEHQWITLDLNEVNLFNKGNNDTCIEINVCCII